jgi:phosphatidylserine/phosphatidylglycerophosphate/cardiolipin synthase-like enzyme
MTSRDRLDAPAGLPRIALALLITIATPAEAAFTVAYAPEVNLERLDVAALARATVSIDIAAYILTDVPMIDALAAAGARGAKVRIYRDPGGYPPRGAVAEALARLQAAPNVEIRTKRHGALMHLKSYLVDGRVLRGGAANFSASGLKSQDNDRFETDDVEAVKAFRSAFDAAWSRP